MRKENRPRSVRAGGVLGTLSVLLALATAFQPASAWAARSSRKPEFDKSGVPLSAPEDAVDRVAQSYDTDAIEKIRSLLKRPKGKDQQAALLDRLAHLQQQRADITFRIAHAAAYEAKRPIDLRAYKSAMKESIGTLSQLIDGFPAFKNIAEDYLFRARAYREVGDRDAAIRDFKVIELKFPEHPEVRAAYLELAELAEEASDYQTAVKYLLMILKSKEDREHYPHALYRLAWAHYQLGNVDKAMAYVRVHTNYQTVLMKRAVLRNEPYAGNERMREDLLEDSALFYLKGLQTKLPEYTVTNALPFFRKLVLNKEADPSFKGMVTRFTALIRAEGMSDQLVAWKDEVIRSLGRREESLKVVSMVLEDQLNKYRYADLKNTVKDITTLFSRSGKLYSFKPAEKMLLEAASRLQEIVSKDKDASSAKEPTIALQGILTTYLGIVPKDDPGLVRVHYNLAEAQSSLGQQDDAAIHYRWIFDNARGWDAKRLGGVNPAEAGLKALAIGYDSLKKKGIIPAALSPRAVPELPDAKALDPGFESWVALLDDIDKATRGKTRSEQLEFFRLECNRAFYSAGKVEDAVKRLDTFARGFPDSNAGVPSAKLVLDTWIASKRWRDAEGVARAYDALKGWKDEKFAKSLAGLAADFAYKATEADFAAKEHQKVLDSAKDFLARYPQSPRREDILSLSSRSALALGKDEAATASLAEIIDHTPKSRYLGQALLTRAELSEKRYDFSIAAADYKRYSELPADRRSLNDSQMRELRKKVLFLSWISGDMGELAHLLHDPKTCGPSEPSLSDLCDRYSILAAIEGGDSVVARLPHGRTIASMGHKGKHSGGKSAENQALVALLDLSRGQTKNIDSRMELAHTVATGWKHIEPLARFSLIPRLNEAMIVTFRAVRGDIRARAKVKMDKSSISRRVKRIQAAEAVATELLSLPFARVQVSLLNELSFMYQDLAGELTALPVPAGLSAEDTQVFRATLGKVAAPFEQAGIALRARAFKSASASTVDSEVFDQVTQPYFAEKPDAAKELLPEGGMPVSVPLTTRLAMEIDPSGGWSAKPESDAEPSHRARRLWAEAVEKHQWALVAHLLSDAQSKSLIPAGTLSVMRAISLAQAGARAEGVAELEASLSKLEGSERARVAATTIRLSMSTLSNERVSRIAQEFDGGKQLAAYLDERERLLVAQWSGG